MPSLHCFSPFNKQPALLVRLRLGFGDGHVVITKTKKNQSNSQSSYVVHAVEKDSQNYDYEVDRDKAKEALRKLDQQLQDLTKKELSSPKIKASDVKFTREEAMGEEVAEIQGSVLANWTVVLFFLTFFYNVLFDAVIKPSLDGDVDLTLSLNPTTTTTTTTTQKEKESSPTSAVLQFLLPPIPEI